MNGKCTVYFCQFQEKSALYCTLSFTFLLIRTIAFIVFVVVLCCKAKLKQYAEFNAVDCFT